MQRLICRKSKPQAQAVLEAVCVFRNSPVVDLSFLYQYSRNQEGNLGAGLVALKFAFR